MEKLNVRFSNKTKVRISKISTELDLYDSMVARAAMNLGLKEISSFEKKDAEKLHEWIKANQ